jgi:hypothetical protein
MRRGDKLGHMPTRIAVVKAEAPAAERARPGPGNAARTDSGRTANTRVIRSSKVKTKRGAMAWSRP